MSLFSRYREYLKQNPEGYWFKRKTYGWGWMPVKWQGWLVVAAFVAFEYWNFLRLDAVSHSNSDTLRPFLIQTVLAVIVLLFVCSQKGETPRWQWGLPADSDNAER